MFKGLNSRSLAAGTFLPLGGIAMTIGIVRAAFGAAIMSLCASTFANAAALNISSHYETGADGLIDFTLSTSASGALTAFKYSESEPAPNFLDTISMSISDPKAMLSTSNATTTPDGFGDVTNTLDWTVSDTTLPWTASNTDGKLEHFKGYDFTFTLYQLVDPNGQVIRYDSSSSLTILGSSYFLSDGSTSVTLAGVPVPSSAPMFGAAVALLGVVSYGLRSKRELHAEAALSSC